VAEAEVEVKRMKVKDSRIAKVLVTGTILAALAAPTAARADDVQRMKSDAGVGLATAVANIFYIPAKLGYAILGGVTGGLAYALTAGNEQVAERVWVASLGGDYIISRQQLQGNEPLRFSGSNDPDM
jgi:hypothetical protein